MKKVVIPSLLRSILIGMLAAVLWLELKYDYGTRLEMDTDKHVSTAKTAPVNMPQPIELVKRMAKYNEISTRPLFNSSRQKPVEAPKKVVVAKPLESITLKLNGVSITDDVKTAIFWHQTEQRFYTIKKGGLLKNWQVIEINPDSVVLDQDGKIMELLLRKL